LEACGTLPVFPIRKHHQLHYWPLGIVGLDPHSEVVRTFHALVHHEFHRKLRALAGLDRRRTDDNGGRSTPLPDLDDRPVQDVQWPIADVGEGENGPHRLA